MSNTLSMAKAINYGGSARKGSLGVFRSIMGKLQTRLLPSKGVKQGHFVVVATEGWKPKRFVLELGYLNDPEFLKLLEQAEEEFGFSQEGTLAIPCRPDDLQRILGIRKL
ncbi:hypothetical protein FEM48_Zijuj12G0043000 [Ziziphus jujuba var. spinosa]|uniref:Small auxin-up RNA n=1 Tax=Ziziphus jujuba var. spinosa TaxID=714518 RepID=A0A978UB50_ZIZJJ|nr:hypothetical protein FEM48_Zijuj12G0043000 [Ziziphus jujuba var. spinosa]